MSKYSGRCDVYDVFVMIRKYTDEELKNNVKVYVGDSETPLELNTQKDLIPYYPHLISCSSSLYNPSLLATLLTVSFACFK